MPPRPGHVDRARPLLLAAVILCSLLLGAPSARARTLQVARPCEGSSSPTFFPSNKRLEVTAGGRQLAVFDAHGSGQQLVWRNRGDWKTRTRGDVTNGYFPGDVTGDRPASIALARGPNGRERAWVAWSGHDFAAGHLLPVKLRRLTGLNSSRGPRVGPEVTIAPSDLGNSGVDIAIESKPSGGHRAALTWLRSTGNGYELVVGWLTDLDAARPTVIHRRVLLQTPAASTVPTLVATHEGMNVVVRGSSGILRVFRHPRAAGLSRWHRSRAGVPVPAKAKPSAVPTGTGEVLVTVQSGANRVKVVKFSPRGAAARVVQKVRGHRQPALARHGRRAWLVMVRRRDGNLVTRSFTRGKGWTQRDRIELKKDPDDHYAWPNALRAPKRRLRVLLQGKGCSNNPNGNEVLFFERSLH